MLEFQKAQMTEIAQKPRPSKNAFCKFASGSKSPPPRKKKNAWRSRRVSNIWRISRRTTTVGKTTDFTANCPSTCFNAASTRRRSS